MEIQLNIKQTLFLLILLTSPVYGSEGDKNIKKENVAVELSNATNGLMKSLSTTKEIIDEPASSACSSVVPKESSMQSLPTPPEPNRLVSSLINDKKAAGIIVEMTGSRYDRSDNEKMPSERDVLDQSVVTAVEEIGKKRGDTVTLLEIGPGGLKQALTITTALMSKGISVNWIFIDPTTIGAGTPEDPDGSNAKESEKRYAKFNEIVEGLKSHYHNGSTAQIVGKFSTLVGYEIYLKNSTEQSLSSKKQEDFKNAYRNWIKDNPPLTTSRMSTLLGEINLTSARDGLFKNDAVNNTALSSALRPDFIVGYAAPTSLPNEVISNQFKGYKAGIVSIKTTVPIKESLTVSLPK